MALDLDDGDLLRAGAVGVAAAERRVREARHRTHPGALEEGRGRGGLDGRGSDDGDSEQAAGAQRQDHTREGGLHDASIQMVMARRG